MKSSALTTKQMKKILEETRQELQSLLEKTWKNGDGEVLSVRDLLKDERVMEHSEPELRELSSDLKRLCIPIFHMGGVNSIHNERYREEMMECEFDRRKPWLKEKVKIKQNGTDIGRQSRPEAECKSVKIAKNTQWLHLKASTVVGEVDKVHTKADEEHAIYGVKTQHHLVCGIFNDVASDPIILFHVDNHDFGKMIHREIKGANERLRRENESLSKPKRDSVKLTLGMLLECPSLKVFHVHDDWVSRIVNGIGAEKNASFYESLSRFVGDYTQEVQRSWDRKDVRSKAKMTSKKDTQWCFTSFKGNATEDSPVYIRSLEMECLNDQRWEKKAQMELFEPQGAAPLCWKPEDHKDKVWGFFDHNEWVMTVQIKAEDWKEMVQKHHEHRWQLKQCQTPQEKQAYAERQKKIPRSFWKEGLEKDEWNIQLKDFNPRGKSEDGPGFNIVSVNPQYAHRLKGFDPLTAKTWGLDRVECCEQPLEKTKTVMGRLVKGKVNPLVGLNSGPEQTLDSPARQAKNKQMIGDLTRGRGVKNITVPPKKLAR